MDPFIAKLEAKIVKQCSKLHFRLLTHLFLNVHHDEKEVELRIGFFHY